MSVHVPVGKENFFSKFFSQEHLPQTFTHFEINLQKCEGLPAKDLNGYSDPYVLFFIKEESVRSTTIKKNLNPVYNERLFIAAPFCDKDNIAVLYIQVMDWDKISNDDNCGVAVYHININELQLGDTKQVKLNLSPEGGSISFSITHHNSITTSIMRNN